eukprot:TRINITY_DN936_c0_g1_i1.p1 TRINITY_DN936_c0_g1~~TRINITY_DN936_c0_g1_i1.p1  ORF type:complete len:173 (-),score=50.65 TRINITY_DN936_c0_g1_i1:90-608(-)
MFFTVQLKKTIELTPQHFVGDLKKTIQRRLHQEEEGKCVQNYGYVIAIIRVNFIGKGKIRAGTGSAYFNVKYTAMVFKPFKGEIIDGIIYEIHNIGFGATIGPTTVFIPTPENYRVDMNNEDPIVVSEDQTTTMKKGDHIRLRIVGSKQLEGKFTCIGTIEGDYLGLLRSDY